MLLRSGISIVADALVEVTLPQSIVVSGGVVVGLVRVNRAVLMGMGMGIGMRMGMEMVAGPMLRSFCLHQFPERTGQRDGDCVEVNARH